MDKLTYVTTLTAGVIGSDPIASLETFQISGGVVTLQAYTATGTRLGSWELGQGTAQSTGSVDPGAAYGVARMSLDLSDGGSRQLQDDQFGRIAEAGSLTVALDRAALSTLRVEAAWIDAGNTGWLYLEDPRGGVTRYTVSDLDLGGSGTLSLDPGLRYGGGGYDAFVQMSYAGGTYLVTLSEGAMGEVTVWRVGTGGRLTETGAVAPGQGLGDASAAVAVEVEGVSYLAVAGQGSGSIGLYQLTAMGGLVRTDHVLDDNVQTRFQGVTVLETATVNGRTYLVAAGRDQGLSVLEVLPGGRLLHWASYGDTLAASLDRVSAIALKPQGNVLQIFASSSTELGVSQFTFDPGATGATQVGGSGRDRLTGTNAAEVLAGGDGDDTLEGGSGDDVLMDGAGDDRLTGGDGADLFVLSADNRRDTIQDFNPRQDRLDLSAFAMLYDISQLDIRPTSTGARLIWRGEEVQVVSESGTQLTAADFANTTLFNLNRPPIGDFTVRTSQMGNDGNNRLEGTAANDELNGMDGNDVLVSRGGDNLLLGGDGIDTVDYSAATVGVSVDLQAGLGQAGSGWTDILVEIEAIVGGGFDDSLAGDRGDNWFLGEAGDDALWGAGGNDDLRGGTGADTVQGGDGDDTILGNSSTDVLYGQGGNDSITGGDGVDRLYGGPGSDYLIGHEGRDEVYGGGGHDELRGSAGDDLLDGGSGDDALHGGTEVDTLRGGDGDDTLYGNQDADVLLGEAGDDILYGGSGQDSLRGGVADDVLWGNDGDDLLNGGGGRDDIYGGSGDDALLGESGDDILFGNEGDDTLDGGAGDDFLRGGTFADTFVFREGRDWIDDFRPADDRLQIDSSLWSGVLTPAQVVDRFGQQDVGAYVLDFGGGNRLTFNGGVSEADLQAVMSFF